MFNSVLYYKFFTPNTFFSRVAFSAATVIFVRLPEEHTTGPSALARAPRLRRIPITVPFWLAVPKTKKQQPTVHSKVRRSCIKLKQKFKFLWIRMKRRLTVVWHKCWQAWDDYCSSCNIEATQNIVTEETVLDRNTFLSMNT